MDKSEQYYCHARDELIPFLQPVAGATILDVGCGAGRLGKKLKGLGCGALYGVEYVQEPAAAAAQHYDKVYHSTIEQVDLSPYVGFFDIVICADVLEHLLDPWAVLSKLRCVLKDNGVLVASIPNVRHRFVIGELLRGKFEYRDEGILDKTHLRFFTFDSVVRMLMEAGLTVERIAPHYTPETGKSMVWPSGCRSLFSGLPATSINSGKMRCWIFFRSNSCCALIKPYRPE
jgi:2-polyprenyl-3-methyl-5-hydroxy-6-metoxy-1,4-benzoquinol methylase